MENPIGADSTGPLPLVLGTGYIGCMDTHHAISSSLIRALIAVLSEVRFDPSPVWPPPFVLSAQWAERATAKTQSMPEGTAKILFPRAALLLRAKYQLVKVQGLHPRVM